MAFSDILCAFFIVPLRMNEIHFDAKWPIGGVLGNISVKLFFFIPDMSTSVSFYSCLFIAIDRYLAVAHPLRGGFSKSRLKFIIAGIWILSGLLLSPYFYFFQIKDINGTSYIYRRDYNFEITHFYILFNLNFVLPVITIASLYGIIIYKLRHHKAPGIPTDIAIRRRQQQNRKVTKMAITILSFLAVLWGFFALVGILFIEGLLKSSATMVYVGDFAGISAFLSLCVNFFIYLVFNKIYRENFKSLITRFCCKFFI